jgi:TolA-binding protein
MARGDHASAAERFEAMSARDPGGAYADRVNMLLAQCLHRSGAEPRAADQYRRVIQRGGDAYVPEAMYGLAVIEHGRGRLDSAGPLLDQLLERYPDHDIAPGARVLRGRVWFEKDEYERALALLREAAESTGAYQDDAAYWSAKCVLRQGRAERAARRLARAIERFPQSDLLPQMTYDRAVALLRAGDSDGALDALSAFDTRFRDHELAADAGHLAASALHEQGRYRESLEGCRAFGRRFMDHELAPEVAFLAAENLFLLKRYDDAAEGCRSLLARWPEHEHAPQARYRLGLSLCRLGSFDEAGQWLQSVTGGRDTAPAFRPALLALGDGHFQRGRWEQAEAHLGDYLSFGLDQSSAGDALLKLGLSQQRQGQPRSALRSLGTLIEELPESPHRVHALFEAGQILIELERPQEAAAAFEAVLAEGADTPFAGHAHNHLGVLSLADKRYLEAASHFGRAADALADEAAAAEALCQQGQALMSARRFDEAAGVFERLARDYPSYGGLKKASALRAIALARRKDATDHQMALAAIKEVQDRHLADLDPPLRDALLYEKAWCLRALGRDEQAAEAYRSMLGKKGSGGLHTHAMLELAELEIEAGRHEQAADLLRGIQHHADEGGNVPRAVQRQCAYRLGLCEYHLGNMDEAARMLEEYLTDEPAEELVPSASLLCAEAHFKAGRHRRAIEHLTRLVEGFPSDEAWAPSLLRLGECYAAIQYWPQSRDAFSLFLDRRPESPMWFQARFGIGWAHENEGQYDEAVEAYRAVTARHQGETAARAQFQIGECLFAQKRYDEAVRELLKVDILYAYPPWSAAALYEAGRCFQEMGSPIDARKQFELLRQQHADTRWAALAGDRLKELAENTLPGH